MTRCDIVLPVFNALHLVRPCLESLFAAGMECAGQVYVIDDAGDHTTAAFLCEEASCRRNIVLHRNSANLGFVKSANLGMELGSSEYIVLMNSDVLITPGWLGRLLRCAESDPRIASVNPLTNYAANIAIPMVPGANFLGMDALLQSNHRPTYPDVVTAVGFCMLLRRSALEKVGYFDEVFGRGYCEDSDLSMRLVAEGYRTVIADDVYVYHRGRGSFADRNERYRSNRRIFDARWGEEYSRQFAEFRRADPLRATRTFFQLPRRPDPLPHMRETYRRMRRCWRASDLTGVLKEAAKGAVRLPKGSRDYVTPSEVARFSRPERLRVTYLVHALTIAGGVWSIVQLVNELITLGVEARIATLRDYPEVYDWKFLTRPMLFKSWAEMIRNLPETDVVVATHWNTAGPARRILDTGRARAGVYFLQDYEPWFFPESEERSRRRVRETYRLLGNKIVKSEWLRDLLLEDGYSSTKILLGMDLSLYYPREIRRSGCPSVLAMARPRTPRRGFSTLIDALARVKEVRPEVNIVLFGEDLSSYQVPFEFQEEGVISNQERLAQLYSTADVFVDNSDFQGFGRVGLEAMACGTTCVLTEVGGVNEYARHLSNCLLIPPKDPQKSAEAILTILEENDLGEKLVNGGLATVKDYCHKREARETLEYFGSITWKA
jgi:O-antigen biosynthesis protein